MAVAAGNTHARLGKTQLGSDDVHDALTTGRRVEERQVIGPYVLLDGGEHLLGHTVGIGPRLLVGRNDVVNRGEGPLRIAHAQPALGKHLEGLRARDLVHQVQADEELRFAVGEAPHGVQVPYGIEQCAGHGAP